MTNAVDGEGLKKSVAAALSAGVSRFLLVSAFPARCRIRLVRVMYVPAWPSRMVTCPVMTWRLRWLNSLSNLPSAASSLS